MAHMATPHATLTPPTPEASPVHLREPPADSVVEPIKLDDHSFSVDDIVLLNACLNALVIRMPEPHAKASFPANPADFLIGEHLVVRSPHLHRLNRALLP